MPELYADLVIDLPKYRPVTGEHLCIACKQCERVCPDNCISVIPHDSVKASQLNFILIMVYACSVVYVQRYVL